MEEIVETIKTQTYNPLFIHDDEYDLTPICFKLFQYLKTHHSTNKSEIARGAKCSTKTIYTNMKLLQELNFIDTWFRVLPPGQWNKTPGNKTGRMSHVTPNESVKPTTINKDARQVKDLNGYVYALVEDLGGRYEVYDVSIDKYTVLNESEIECIF